MFTGVYVAIITPFNNGKIDQDALRNHVDWLLSEGVHGIVPCGTTGEGATLTYNEYAEVVKIVSEVVNGRCKIIAGAGANSTAKAIETARLVIESGADATLQVTPYYNKPSQEGLFEHYKAIAENVKAPHVLYNVPGRTALNMLASTTVRLSKIDNIVAVKEASGDLNQVKEIRENTDNNFSVLSGNDDQNLEIYKLGGTGAISVTANVAPKLTSSVWDLFSQGNVEKANETQDSLAALNDAMFIETNPIPVKTSIAIMKRCNEEFRLPLTKMNKEHRNQLYAILKSYELL